MGLDGRIRALMLAARVSGRGFRPEWSVEHFRAVYASTNRQFGLRSDAAIAVRDFTIPVDGGTIGARLYRPAEAGTRALPLLVFYHGGGFVIGDVASYDPVARFVVATGGIAVCSVDYRLAPEFRAPVAHEDGRAAYAWIVRHAADLGADPARIAVGGDSAGGGIAAAAALHARADGVPSPAFALLIYPSVDGTGATPSRRAPLSDVPLTPEVVDWFIARYAPSAEVAAGPLLAPLRVPSLAGFPPTYLLAAQYDPLLDEGRLFAERLRAEGVAVTYDLRPTLAHGFLNIAGAVPAAERAVRDAVGALARALAAAPA